MIAGSKADSLYMTEEAFAKATGAKDKELAITHTLQPFKFARESLK
jgi:hypothetical protein